jgi:adenosylmethionine-8-amino-7-oxononanoate aminotransferase
MRLLNQTVRENGLHPFIIWNMFFNCPPLSITEAQLQEGLAIVDHALSKLDAFYEG